MADHEPTHAVSVDLRTVLQPKTNRTAWGRAQRILLEFAAVSFWSYGLIQVFVANTDDLFVSHLPTSFQWVVNFKFLLFLAVACVFWLLLGTGRFIFCFLNVVFYPFVLLFIRLPVFLYRQKSWALVLFVTNSIVTLFSNLKYSLLFVTAFLSAGATALFSSSAALSALAAVVLLVLVCIAFGWSFVAALSTSALYKLYSQFFQNWRKSGNSNFVLDEELKNLPIVEMSSGQLEVWNSRLQSSVLFNRVCLFAATRLEDYQASGWRVIPGVIALCGLIAFTIISFGAIYLALYKYDASQFTVSRSENIFAFMYYSFNVQVFSSSPDVIAVGTISQSLSMLQSALSLFVGVILTTLIVSDRSQRTSTELKKAIAELNSEAESIHGLIREEFKMSSISEALEHLRGAKSDIVQILYWLTKNLNEPRD